MLKFVSAGAACAALTLNIKKSQCEPSPSLSNAGAFEAGRVKDDDTLNLQPRLVQVVTRHGHRTPISRISEMVPDKHWKEWGSCSLPVNQKGEAPPPQEECGLGMLTKWGVDELKSTGSFLRNRYVTQFPLISPDFKCDQLIVRSTKYDRTILSAQSLLRGLYPDISNLDLGTIVHVASPVEELLYPNYNSCDKLKLINREFRENVFTTEPSDPSRVALRDLFTKHYKLTKPHSFLHLTDHLLCYTHSGGEFPEWMTPEHWQLANQSALNEFARSSTSSDAAISLAIGRLLGELLYHMDAAIRGKEPVKMMIFSCHDTTLIPLLKALDLWDEKWPPFAGNCIIELLEKQGSTEQDRDRWFVRLLVNREPVGLFKLSQFRKAASIYATSATGFLHKCKVTGDIATSEFDW